MILNATNIKMLCGILGSPFIEDWYGRKIELTVSKVKAFGEIHDALRIVGKIIYTPSQAELDAKERTNLLAFLNSEKLTLARLDDFTNSATFTKYESDTEIINLVKKRQSEL